MKSCLILISAHSSNFCKKLDARLFYLVFHENDIKLNYPGYHQLCYLVVNSVSIEVSCWPYYVSKMCFLFCPFKLLLYASYLPSNGRVAHKFLLK